MTEVETRILELIAKMRERDAALKRDRIVSYELGSSHFYGRESAMKEIEQFINPSVLIKEKKVEA